MSCFKKLKLIDLVAKLYCSPLLSFKEIHLENDLFSSHFRKFVIYLYTEDY